jgi:hypothetical protein
MSMLKYEPAIWQESPAMFEASVDSTRSPCDYQPFVGQPESRTRVPQVLVWEPPPKHSISSAWENPASFLDSIQETSPDIEEFNVDELKGRIRLLYKELPPEEAVEEICLLWNRLDEVARMAEARVSALLKKIPLPEVPTLGNQDHSRILEKLSDIKAAELNNPLHPVLIESAERLLMLVSAIRNNLDDCRVERWSKGRLIIEFGSENRTDIQWILSSPDMAWPGVNILAIDHRDSRNTTVLRTASQVLAYIQKRAK